MRQNWEIISDQMAEILRQKRTPSVLRSVDASWKSARAILKQLFARSTLNGAWTKYTPKWLADQ